MFCTSLRRRSSFAPAVSTLKAPPLSLRESQLGTHHLEVPFGSRLDSQTGNTLAARHLRCLLISPTDVRDVQLNNTLHRLQHFAALTGGRDTVVVFLLSPARNLNNMSTEKLTSPSESTGCSQGGYHAYLKFQMEMINHPEIPHVPTLPLSSLDGLQQQLLKYTQRQTNASVESKLLATSLDILQQCTADPPMSQQTAYILSDVFPSVRALGAACSSLTSAPNSSSPSARAVGLSSQLFDIDEVERYATGPWADANADGKLKTLRDLVGDRACQSIVEFWKEEFVVD